MTQPLNNRNDLAVRGVPSPTGDLGTVRRNPDGVPVHVLLANATDATDSLLHQHREQLAVQVELFLDTMARKKVNRVDPSRTAGLRRIFTSEMTRRYNDLRQRVTSLFENPEQIPDLGEENAVTDLSPTVMAVRRTYVWRSDPRFVEKFDKWFEKNIDATVMRGPAFGTSRWTDQYVTSAYRQGIARAQQELVKAKLTPKESRLLKSSPSGPLMSAFTAPVHMNRVALLATRAYGDLKGITAKMHADVRRTLVQGMVDGKNPRELGRLIAKRVDVSKSYARTLARTEVLRAHNSANIQTYRDAGLEGVKVMAEWHATPDDRVCEHCASLEGKVYSLDKMESLIPLHPNCRCVALPVVEKGQQKAAETYDKSMSGTQAKSKKQAGPKSAADKAARRAIRQAELQRRKILREEHGMRGAQVFGDSLKKVKRADPGGSTGAFFAEDENGRLWVLKHYNGEADQVRNEYIANQLYKAAGVDVPTGRLAMFDGRLHYASEFDPQLKTVRKNELVRLANKPASGINSGFVTDAWLANWDVVGLDYDNMLVKAGKVYRVDHGGALMYRAQGATKGEAFGKVVQELASLRSAAVNEQSAAVFSTISDTEIRRQIRALTRRMTPARINGIIQDAGGFGGGATSTRRLFQTLDDRLADLSQWSRESAKKRLGTSAFTLVDDASTFNNTATETALIRQGVTRESIQSAKGYTGADVYKHVNKIAVRYKNKAAGMSTHVRNLDDLFHKDAKTRWDGWLVRRMKLSGNEIRKYVQGFDSAGWNHIEWSAYSSASFDPSQWQGNVSVYIRTRGKNVGTCVAPISEHPSELEYLFARNARFYVHEYAVSSGGDKLTLFVDEIPAKRIVKRPYADIRERLKKVHSEMQKASGALRKGLKV